MEGLPKNEDGTPVCEAQIFHFVSTLLHSYYMGCVLFLHYLKSEIAQLNLLTLITYKLPIVCCL